MDKQFPNSSFQNLKLEAVLLEHRTYIQGLFVVMVVANFWMGMEGKDLILTNRHLS